MARVLVVDRQGRSVARVVDALARTHGHDVVWARTARGAIWALDEDDTYEPDLAAGEVQCFGQPLEEMLRGDGFDVVVLDMLLDLGADGNAMTDDAEAHQLGRQILSWLRGDRGSDVPVVVWSAFLDDAARRQVQGCGGVRIVDKLRPAADVLREIEAALAARPSRRVAQYISDEEVCRRHDQAEVNVLVLAGQSQSRAPREIVHETLEMVRESTFAAETALVLIRPGRPYRVLLGSQSAQSFVPGTVPAEDGMDQWAPGREPHTRVNGHSTWSANIGVDNYVAARVGTPGQGIRQLLATQPPPTLALLAANRAPAGSDPSIPLVFSSYDARHMARVAGLLRTPVSQLLKGPVGRTAISLLAQVAKSGPATAVGSPIVRKLVELWQYHMPKGDTTETVICELIQVADAVQPAPYSASAFATMAQVVSRAVTGGIDEDERLWILGQLAEAGLRRR